MKERIGRAVLVLVAAAALALVLMITFGPEGGGADTTQAEGPVAEDGAGPETMSHRPPCRNGHDCDGDGCHDDQEDGSDETLGGLRDKLSEWDWYDVENGDGDPEPDGVIDLFNDIQGVIDHYAPIGNEPEYDVHYDRGPVDGPDYWNMTEPDGVIDLFNDISGVVDQYGHDCRHTD